MNPSAPKPPLTRRRFLGSAAKTGLATALLPFADARADDDTGKSTGTARSVIYLYMRGGMSHLDTFDPKPGTKVQSPTKPIPTVVPGILLGEHFDRLATLMDKAALVRSISHRFGSPDLAYYLTHTAYAPRSTIAHPALGAWVSSFRNRDHTGLPGYVLVNGPAHHPGAGFLPAPHGPVPVADPNAALPFATIPHALSPSRFDQRYDLAYRFAYHFQEKHPDSALVTAYSDLQKQALRLTGSQDLAAFDLAFEDSKSRAAYGSHPFGQGCLLARRLVEHGVPYVEVNLDGWDTNTENFKKMAVQIPILDQALSALLIDLDQRGILAETLVVVATEFGRSPAINARNGRDKHPHAFSHLFAGGGVKGGFVYGETDMNGMRPVANPVTPQQINATIAHALGLPLKETVFSPTGRPFTIADKAAPILELLE